MSRPAPEGGVRYVDARELLEHGVALLTARLVDVRDGRWVGCDRKRVAPCRARQGARVISMASGRYARSSRYGSDADDNR